jgi:hypothetical protein
MKYCFSNTGGCDGRSFATRIFFPLLLLLLMTFVQDGTIRQWSLKSGECQLVIKVPNGEPVRRVSLTCIERKTEIV